jgi:hypothetical protein
VRPCEGALEGEGVSRFPDCKGDMKKNDDDGSIVKRKIKNASRWRQYLLSFLKGFCFLRFIRIFTFNTKSID